MNLQALKNKDYLVFHSNGVGLQAVSDIELDENLKKGIYAEGSLVIKIESIQEVVEQRKYVLFTVTFEDK